MNHYSIILTRRAQKQLDKIPNPIVKPILSAIEGLSKNPRPNGYKKLIGREGYRIRSGNYRIIYSIYDNSLIVEVIDLGHRKDIYG